MTKSNMTVSKLQSKAVKGLMKLKETLIYDEEVSDEDAERDAENQLKQFLSDQIQKAVEETRKEERLFVMAIYHKAVEELFNKEIADNITKQAGIVYKKYKLSIQSKENKMTTEGKGIKINCPNCGKPMTQVWDKIAKKYTGHLWRCSCMSKDTILSIG
jgi:predicted RNA-binding Zn-ribbon protein involved in translation (DUF1610 family)